MLKADGPNADAVVADPSHFNASAVKMLRRGRYKLLHQGGDVVAAWRLLRHHPIAIS